MTKDLNDLIISIKNNDEMAVAKLYEEIKPKSIAIAKQYVNAYDAEDLFHNSFIKALDHIDSFDEGRDFMPWFDTILVNTCKNFLRKKENSATSSFSAMEGDSSTSDNENSFINSLKSTDNDYNPEESLDAKALKEIMGQIISTLSDEQREALILFYYNEMSVKDIAKKVGVSENTIKSRLNYARKKVGQDVETYEKKNGIKLRSLGAIPLLLIFLRTSEGSVLASSISATAVGTGTTTGIKAGLAKFISTAYGKAISVVAGLAVAGGVIAGVALSQTSANNDLLVYQVTTTMPHYEGQLVIDSTRVLGSHTYIEKDAQGNYIINSKNPYSGYQNASTTENQLADILLDHKEDLFDYYQKINEIAANYSNKNPDCAVQDIREETYKHPLDMTEFFPEELTIKSESYGNIKLKITKVEVVMNCSTVLEDEALTDTRPGSVIKISENGPSAPITFFDAVLVDAETQERTNHTAFLDSFYINFYGEIIE